jgi:hypothetical protein
MFMRLVALVREDPAKVATPERELTTEGNAVHWLMGLARGQDTRGAQAPSRGVYLRV